MLTGITLKNWCISVIALLTIVGCLKGEDAEMKKDRTFPGTITGENVNLRKEPHSTSEVVTIVGKKDNPIIIYYRSVRQEKINGYNGIWLFIETSTKKKGWIYWKYVRRENFSYVRPRFTRQEYDECIGKFEKDLIGLKLFYMFGDTSFVESFKVNSLDNVEIKTGVEWRPYGKTLKGKLIIKYVDLEYPQVTLYVNDKLKFESYDYNIIEDQGVKLEFGYNSVSKRIVFANFMTEDAFKARGEELGRQGQ